MKIYSDQIKAQMGGMYPTHFEKNTPYYAEIQAQRAEEMSKLTKWYEAEKTKTI